MGKSLLLSSLCLIIFGCASVKLIGQNNEKPNQETKSQEKQNNRLYKELKIGNLTLEPTFNLDQTFDSNIFREEDEESDFITTFSPGVNLNYEQGDFVGNTNYTANVIKFWDNSDADDTEHLGDGKYKYEFSDHFTASIGGYYRSTSTPIGDIVLTDRVNLDRWNLYETLTYENKKLTATIKYTEGKKNYNDPFDRLDSHSWRTNASLSYKFTDRIKGLVGLEEGGRNYDSAKSDSDHVFYKSGIEWRLKRNLGIKLEMGYLDEEFDSESTGGAGDNNNEELIYRVECIWFPRKGDLFRASYKHQTGYSVLSNFVKKDIFSVDYQKKFTDKLSASLNLSYEDANESGDSSIIPRDEKEYFRGGLSVSRTLTRWIDLNAGWNFEDKSTNDDTGEFTDHRFNVGVQFRF